MTRNTSPSQAKTGDDAAITPHGTAQPMSSPDDDNSASALIEAPRTVAKDRGGKLQRHDFSDGGGSGGAEAFRRGKRHVDKP